MRSHWLLMTAFAPLLLLPAYARSQDGLPMPVGDALTPFVQAMNDAFNDDLEDICHCRNVAEATRFEEMVEKLKEMEEALDPERIREGLLEEGVDVPVEPGDTPRTYLERARRTVPRGAPYPMDPGPLYERVSDLAQDAELLDDMIQYGSQPGKGGIPYRDAAAFETPPGVDREVEILRTLREALADCREDEEVPLPPAFSGDMRAGLVIDPGGDAAPPTSSTLRDALLHELRNLCCKLHGDEAFGAWMGNATRGLDAASPDVQAAGMSYPDLLYDLRWSMDNRDFHLGDQVDEFRVRERCGNEIVDRVQAGLVLEEDVDDASEVGTPGGPPEPSVVDPTPVPSDETTEETDETDETDEEADEEPGPRDPPPGFRHVTRGSDPSRYTPESNHVAEGPDASARVRDFFEEGRGVPHVEDGVFTDRHLTVGEHASQYVDPELHLAEGPDASTLKGGAPTPREGERHLTRGPGATSYVPEERHVTEGSEASGLRRGGGGAGQDDEDEDEEDEEEEEEKDEDEDEDDDTGGELARNPEDHNPDEIDDAPPARGVQRMVIEIEQIRTTDGQEGPGGWSPLPGADGATPDVYLVSLGTSTGRTFLVHAVGEAADLSGVVVAEPVAVPARERRRIDERLRAEGATGVPTDGYCLEFERLVPPAGTLFRLASRSVQEEHAPQRRILAATRRLMDAGALSPDSDPESYFHAIRQWAIWTREQGFTEQGFAEAFVGRTRKNFRAAGQEWNDRVEAAVRALLPNRWRDVRAVLREAGE